MGDVGGSGQREGGGPALLKRRSFLLALGALATWIVGCTVDGRSRPDLATETDTKAGPGDVLGVIRSRRSIREFATSPVSAEQVTVMVQAAQGVTDPAKGFRAAPSAGALYPLEVYVANAQGTRRYNPAQDSLDRVSDTDVRRALAEAALAQDFIAEAPVVFAITGVYARTAAKYGDERAPRYVHLEAGHAAQNLLLVAEHLDLGGVGVGAFDDEEVRSILGASDDETPLYVIPVGHPSSG